MLQNHHTCPDGSCGAASPTQAPLRAWSVKLAWGAGLVAAQGASSRPTAPGCAACGVLPPPCRPRAAHSRPSPTSFEPAERSRKFRQLSEPWRLSCCLCSQSARSCGSSLTPRGTSTAVQCFGWFDDCPSGSQPLCWPPLPRPGSARLLQPALTLVSNETELWIT